MHRGSSILRRLSALCLTVGIAGCTVVGPDFEGTNPVSMPTEWEPVSAESERRDVSSWWEAFGDPVLTDLVDRGARQNLSLEAAGLRIVQARAALGITDALVFPQVQQVTGNLTRSYANDQSFNSFGVGLDVAWEMDVWGKYARGIESAEAGLYASIASYRDVLVTLCSEIARNYINYRTAQQRIVLSQQNIAIQERVVEMTQVQYDAGNVSELDVQQARTQLYATRASLPNLNTARVQAANAIAVLLGSLPEEVEPLLEEGSPADAGATFEDRMGSAGDQGGVYLAKYDDRSVIPDAPTLDTRIDPALVLARPDLQVAELLARSQSARIGLAKSELYPQFFLFGSIGLAETVAGDEGFSASNALTAAIGPGLSWNVLQYGRIKNQVRIEDAAFQESLVNYSQSVLQAVAEITGILQSYQYALEKSEYDFEAVTASVRAFNISANQYNNGLVSYQRLLSTVEKMTLREDTYAVTRGNIANQIVALYKALGGGWQAYAELDPVRPATVEQMRERTDWGDRLETPATVGDDRNE